MANSGQFSEWPRGFSWNPLCTYHDIICFFSRIWTEKITRCIKDGVFKEMEYEAAAYILWVVINSKLFVLRVIRVWKGCINRIGLPVALPKLYYKMRVWKQFMFSYKAALKKHDLGLHMQSVLTKHNLGVSLPSYIGRWRITYLVLVYFTMVYFYTIPVSNNKMF